jgi:glycosyltransferase involved in cell wall biosynthesis
MELTPQANAPVEGWIALLGRRDAPTDGIEDYCSFLGDALSKHSIGLQTVRVRWAEEGWRRALTRLWGESSSWRASWVLLQFTTMAWSRRGFPFGALAGLTILRCRGVRCAVVFHEPFRQPGRRSIDRLRGYCQDLVIRRLYRGAAKAIFAHPLEKIGWLPRSEPKATFVPIGANIPERQIEVTLTRNGNGGTKTVAVFCLSDPPHRNRELGDISYAMRFLAQQGLKARVVFLGRGTAEAREDIGRLFEPSAGDVVNLGLQSAAEVTRILSQSDAMLCVRGPVFPTRGSAIAGIACGLPIVGYAGCEEGTPLEDAGLALAPYRDHEALAKQLARVLGSDDVRMELQRRSQLAQRRHFDWGVIASQVVSALNGREEQTEQ